MNIKAIVTPLEQTEHGFKHIIAAGDELLKQPHTQVFRLAQQLLQHSSYQARMLATHLLGSLSVENKEAFQILHNTVAKDDNWRVQEMLAKAFDHYCSTKGYGVSLPVIKNWLKNRNPNVVRAVIEGLRIWTSRPYFKEHPEVAVQLISAHHADDSEYVRKSVGNALRDISRKHPDLIKQEIAKWNTENSNVAFTAKLAIKA